MTQEIDSAAFEVGEATCAFSEGRVSAVGAAAAAHFSDTLGSIYVEAAASLLSARPPAGQTQPGLTVVLEDSVDGASWATLHSFVFTEGGKLPGVSIDSPRAYLRMRWADVVGTWSIDVEVKSLDAASSQDGGSAPFKWVRVPVSYDMPELASHAFPITAVDQGIDHFSIAGNHLDFFPSAGKTFTVTGSTGNDGTYLCNTSIYDAGTDTTQVFTAAPIPDPTADGQINVNGVFVEVYVPAAGEYLLDGWCEVDTAWNGTTPLGDFSTAAVGDVVATWVDGVYNDVTSSQDLTVDDDVGPTAPVGRGSIIGANKRSMAHEWSTIGGQRVFPCRFIGPEFPLYFVVSTTGEPAGDATGATQGSGTVVLLIGTP